MHSFVTISFNNIFCYNSPIISKNYLSSVWNIFENGHYLTKTKMLEWVSIKTSLAPVAIQFLVLGTHLYRPFLLVHIGGVNKWPSVLDHKRIPDSSLCHAVVCRLLDRFFLKKLNKWTPNIFFIVINELKTAHTLDNTWNKI